MTSPSDKEAAEKHSLSEGDNGNAEISFLAGCAHKEKRILEMLRSGSPGQDKWGWQWAEWLEAELKKDGMK